MRKFNTCFISMCMYQSCSLYMYILHIKFYFGPFYGSVFDRDNKKVCLSLVRIY